MKISEFLDIEFENDPKLGKVVKLNFKEITRLNEETGESLIASTVKELNVKKVGETDTGEDILKKDYQATLSLETLKKLLGIFNNTTQDPELFFSELDDDEKQPSGLS